MMSLTHNGDCCRHGDFSFQDFRSSSKIRQKRLTQKLDAQKDNEAQVTTFPPPQVLPGDSLDPEYFDLGDAQSFQDWIDDEHRNRVTCKRQTIYIHHPPKVCSNLEIVQSWKKPKLCTSDSIEDSLSPDIGGILRYIESFYWPLPVKTLKQFEFVDYESLDDAKEPVVPFKKRKRDVKRKQPLYIGLANHSTKSVTRINVRQKRGQLYTHQISTNDLIDSLLESLPADAYAAVLLLEHDLYEDEGDEFILGRAYGGSRVAVVSMARYNPCLDRLQNVPGVHAWPFGYCSDFLRKEGLKVPKSKTVLVSTTEATPSEPVIAAIHHELLQRLETGNESRRKTWLFRVCRTVSHELGHCFGIDHCIHFACIMQSSASLSEDARQPSYLCPVDFAKVLSATGAESVGWLLNMAGTCSLLGPNGGFGALGAWVSTRAKALASGSESAKPPGGETDLVVVPSQTSKPHGKSLGHEFRRI